MGRTILRLGSGPVIRTAAVVVALLGATLGTADADDPKPSIGYINAMSGVSVVPTSLAFGDDVSLTMAAAMKQAEARTAAASDCVADRKVRLALALALVQVDRKGRTRKVTVAGSGVPALDRCFERAIKPATWGATASGGAIVLEIRRIGIDHLFEASGSLESLDPVAGGGKTVVIATGGGRGDIHGGLKPDEVSVEVGPVSGPATAYANAALKVVRAHMLSIRACYDRALRTDPNARGTLQIQIKIGLDGRVGSVAVTGGLSSELDACIGRQLRKLTFPKPGAEVELTIPLTVDAP